MNDQERIAQLEAMLTEERDKVYHVLGVLESYARGLDMMARTVYAETPPGSRDEKNASAVKQHTIDMVGWLGVNAYELRGLMGRALPAGLEVAPNPPDDLADLPALLFGPEDKLADPSVPAENVDQAQAVTIH